MVAVMKSYMGNIPKQVTQSSTRENLCALRLFLVHLWHTKVILLELIARWVALEVHAGKASMLFIPLVLVTMHHVWLAILFN